MENREKFWRKKEEIHRRKEGRGNKSIAINIKEFEKEQIWHWTKIKKESNILGIVWRGTYIR